ncbi:hypothetical protein [Paenibacillus sp. N3.4]|uniref:hypothetical protein n=1 Tax=Paenibacillus sp. N3.4 TaxID=2603222 RepID=UPI00164F0810|nr:hypothetical protein [Paenibacillus sp. N3.4]
MNQICEIVRAIHDAGINIKSIDWDGFELNISTTDPEKTNEILRDFSKKTTHVLT